MLQPIQLRDVYKGYTLDQDKAIAPEETVRRLRRRLAAVDLDILENTLRVDTGRLGIPVYFATCGRDARGVTGTRKQMGKGATPQQAEASAVMELTERFSLFSFMQNADNFFTATPARLRDEALPFEWIARSVNDDSDELDVSRRLYERLTLRWTWAHNLTRRSSVCVPFDWFFAINEFNGPAAGNCPEEALCQGICEVVERHACSLISRRKLQVPPIRTAGADDPAVRTLLDKYARAGIELLVSDFSLDTGIPTVGALAYDPATFPERSEIVWTAGTTPGPQKALSRALTEVAQLAGDFETTGRYVASGLPKPQSLEDVSHLNAVAAPVDLNRMPDLSDANIRIEVENLLAALKRREMEVLTIDISHPLLAVPAFYTLIPGAHFRQRAAGSSVGMITAKLIARDLPAQAAIDALGRIDRMLPDRYYVHFYLGSCHLASGDPAAALECFRRSLTLEPHPEDIASIYSYMGVCLKEMARFREAIDILRRGMRYDRERTDLHNLMGFCHFKLKEHRQAIASFNEVLRLDPGSAIDYANIATNYRELGEAQKAVAFYEIALSLDPTLTFARENLDHLRRP